MTKRESALDMIRKDEQRALRYLGRARGLRTAFTLIEITRKVYSEIEKPPTRHHLFTIRTTWKPENGRFASLGHTVLVKNRPQRGVLYREVRAERPGVFGGSR